MIAYVGEGNNRRYTVFAKSLAEELYANNVPQAEIAAQLGVPERVVRNLLWRMGVTVPHNTEERRKLLLKLWNKHRGHITQQHLCTLLGCTHTTVRSDMRALGLYPRFVERRTKRSREKVANAVKCRWQAERNQSVYEGWPPVTASFRGWLEALEKCGVATIPTWLAAVEEKVVPTRAEKIARTLFQVGYVVRIGRRRFSYVYALSQSVVDTRTPALLKLKEEQYLAQLNCPAAGQAH